MGPDASEAFVSHALSDACRSSGYGIFLFLRLSDPCRVPPFLSRPLANACRTRHPKAWSQRGIQEIARDRENREMIREQLLKMLVCPETHLPLVQADAELMTKVNILKDEFTHINQYSPIEHVTSRVKSPDSILRKAQRLNVPLTIDDI